MTPKKVNMIQSTSKYISIPEQEYINNVPRNQENGLEKFRLCILEKINVKALVTRIWTVRNRPCTSFLFVTKSC